MFVGFCKCKDCVLFPSLMFHNELVNVVSARLLLTAAICFVQAVAQLLKPHLMALLHLTSCLLSWSCAWMKTSQDSQFANCMPWTILYENTNLLNAVVNHSRMSPFFLAIKSIFQVCKATGAGHKAVSVHSQYTYQSASLKSRGGEPIYDHRPHELFIFVCGPKNQ